MLKLTINQRIVEANPGATVLEAAQSAGVYIPALCFHPKVGQSGNCRMCVVEIEGMRGLQLACMSSVAAGMVVHTETPLVQDARKSVMELLLAEGVHDVSDPGRSELAAVAAHVGMAVPQLPQIKRQHHADDSHREPSRTDSMRSRKSITASASALAIRW